MERVRGSGAGWGAGGVVQRFSHARCGVPAGGGVGGRGWLPPRRFRRWKRVGERREITGRAAAAAASEGRGDCDGAKRQN